MSINYKKIIFTGPPGVGKSSIKKIFFDKINPESLLNEPLQPTRGIDSDIYSIFNKDIGIFDLAGQENHHWLENDFNIFDFSNLIICIFDITNSLESILDYLIKIFILKRELKLEDTKILIFLNKIDLVNDKYVKLKLNVIQDFLDGQRKLSGNYRLFKTSISKEYILQTFMIIFEIIDKLCNFQNKNISHKIFQKIQPKSSFFVNHEKMDIDLKEFLNDLKKINNRSSEEEIKELTKIGFFNEFSSEDLFKLKEGTCIFSFNIEKNENMINRINIIDFFENMTLYVNIFKKEKSSNFFFESFN